MEKAYAYINPEIITWARERAGLTIDELAQKVFNKPNGYRILDWENGKNYPTFNQAHKIASSTYIPFGFLYLPSPPEEDIPIPDFRKKAESKSYKMSINMRDAIEEVLDRQDWYRDYVIDEVLDEPLSFVGQFNLDSSIDSVCNDMRDVLGIPSDFYREFDDAGTYLSSLIRKAELAGVTVFKSGYVGTNTRRPLNPDEFRGFALSDNYAPVIFINTKDFEGAKLFTFYHELAHIWINESGISDFESSWSGHKDVERFCNEVAAEMLVPKNDFHKEWSIHENHIQQVKRLAYKPFKVSILAIARRAFELRYISPKEHDEIYAMQRKNYKKSPKQKKSTGGSYYSNMQSKNGLLFSHAVITELRDGNLTYKDASRILSIGIHSIDKYEEHITKSIMSVYK